MRCRACFVQPLLEVIGVEADVVAEAVVRYALGAGLREQPGVGDVEQLRGGQPVFTDPLTLRTHPEQSQEKRRNLARKRPVFGLCGYAPQARRERHPLSAPGGFASATGARHRGAAAVTLRPSDADPDTRLHGRPGPSSPGNPPACDAGKHSGSASLAPARPAAPQTSHALARIATPPRATWPSLRRAPYVLPGDGTCRRNRARAREGSPHPTPRSLTRTEPERFLSLRRRFRRGDRSLTPVARVLWRGVARSRLGLASTSSARIIAKFGTPLVPWTVIVINSAN